MKPVRYFCGTEAQVGDKVDFDGEPAVVESVIATSKDQAAWGLNDRGLMFQSDRLGLVFEAEHSASWPENVFLGRAA